jgi:hypothetical protein
MPTSSIQSMLLDVLRIYEDSHCRMITAREREFRQRPSRTFEK